MSGRGPRWLVGSPLSSPSRHNHSPGLRLLFSLFSLCPSGLGLPVAARSLFCVQVRSAVNPLPGGVVLGVGTPPMAPSAGGSGPGTQGRLPVHALGAPAARGLPCPEDSPLELLFLRMEARTRSEPRWAWWCRWARASWNQSPVRTFSCPGSAREARSLLEDWGGGGWLLPFVQPTFLPPTLCQALYLGPGTQAAGDTESRIDSTLQCGGAMMGIRRASFACGNSGGSLLKD